MWVIFLEAGVALALLLVIVWATRPRRPDAARTPETPAVPTEHAESGPSRETGSGAPGFRPKTDKELE